MQKYNKNKKIKYIRRNERNVRVLHRRCDGQQQRQIKLILIVAYDTRRSCGETSLYSYFFA